MGESTKIAGKIQIAVISIIAHPTALGGGARIEHSQSSFTMSTGMTPNQYYRGESKSHLFYFATLYLLLRVVKSFLISVSEI